MKYGDLPISLGLHEVRCDEMMFYQYMPIKMINDHKPIVEQRLGCFEKIIGLCCCDYIGHFGLNDFIASYIYFTAKKMYQLPGCSFNRPGYHSDGFLTDDINYIWCDNNPTIFNTSNYSLTMHHEYSLTEMDMQSLKDKEVRYRPNELLRLNQFNIHKVADIDKPIMRTFLKLSFSKERYNLIGNTHNYQLNYDWEMKQREDQRNHPSK